ncbi:hypothetical protein L596_006850 [Steinernema carpocapsae]|uniref:Uncharacterized protein n=1 Tax=Steinernema carpocapsae TaxID=34508 RepID=A0A4U5P787_STECR|nr:hypothetical protein L596_006850 [Steinernema carpocapsae]
MIIVKFVVSLLRLPPPSFRMHNEAYRRLIFFFRAFGRFEELTKLSSIRSHATERHDAPAAPLRLIPVPGPQLQTKAPCDPRQPPLPAQHAESFFAQDASDPATARFASPNESFADSPHPQPRTEALPKASRGARDSGGARKRPSIARMAQGDHPDHPQEILRGRKRLSENFPAGVFPAPGRFSTRRRLDDPLGLQRPSAAPEFSSAQFTSQRPASDRLLRSGLDRHARQLHGPRAPLAASPLLQLESIVYAFGTGWS